MLGADIHRESNANVGLDTPIPTARKEERVNAKAKWALQLFAVIVGLLSSFAGLMSLLAIGRQRGYLT